MQQYMMNSNGLNENLLNKYLHSKTKDLKFTTGAINKKMDPYFLTNNTMNKIKREALERMSKGEQISLGIEKYNSPIRFIDMKTGKVICSTFNWNEGGGHAVKVTKVRDDGFIVSTWGKQCLVPFSDLQQSGAFATFYSKLETNVKNVSINKQNTSNPKIKKVKNFNIKKTFKKIFKR